MDQVSLQQLLNDVFGKPKAYVQTLTEEQIRIQGRDYNPALWDRIIDRFASYANVKFYKIPSNSLYLYDRFYAVFTADNGINVLRAVSYSSCLNNVGYVQVSIDMDGGLRTYGFGENGNQRADKTNPKNLAIFAQRSRDMGHIYTTEF